MSQDETKTAVEENVKSLKLMLLTVDLIMLKTGVGDKLLSTSRFKKIEKFYFI